MAPPEVDSVDWGIGGYEHLARDLLPASRAAVERANPARSEMVVDIGCGTGNASLLAAERGALVVGVDPSARLLTLARAAALARGCDDATFIRGEAAAIPLPDGFANVVLSVFGVSLARDARSTAAELGRITAPRGRIVLCDWIPEGAFADVMRIRREAAMVVGGLTLRPRLAWHTKTDVSNLLGPYGFSSVDVQEGSIAFKAESAQAFVDSEFRDHPMWIALHAALSEHGVLSAVRARVLDVLDAANEDMREFRLTSRYALVTACRTS